jgi:tetratricopeptide (TPR) repeat protein
MSLFKLPIELGTPFAPLREAPNDPRLYMLLIPMFTLGPLAEELFFRGFLYDALRRWIAPLAAIGLQALAFVLIHYRMPYVRVADLIGVFLIGLALVGVYEWRKTLWAPIALHSRYNLLFAGPVIALMILNAHVPAKTWEEAEQPPGWLTRGFIPVERRATAEAQRLEATELWGANGLHLWKQEIQSLETLCRWFPDDRPVCARARARIAVVYMDCLKDLRRAVVECNRVLSEFPDQPEWCAHVLITRAWAYQQLNEPQKSRDSYREVIDTYSHVEWAREAAEQGLKQLEDQK